MEVSVWAPTAKRLELVLPQGRIAMHRAQPAERGYWVTDLEPQALEAGYRFSIDGGEPIPDPRSRWQPQGVHGPSFAVQLPPVEVAPAVADAARPLHDAVIYELHIGTFTPAGTYAGARERLPHLVELGITHVELMPLATAPGRRGWGYDGVDLYAPYPAYGEPAQLAEFVRDCHAHGLKVLLDVVYNHLGPDGNYLGQFGPYFTDHYRTGWGAAMNYDGAGSDEVRRFIIDNALMWLRDYGFDGLRLDAVHAIYSFGALHVLEELATEVKNLGEQLGRTLVLIAESDMNDPRLVRPVSKGGLGLDAQWSDDFHHALHAFFAGETDGYYADFGGLAPLASALAHGYVFRGEYSAFRARRHGRIPSGVRPDQFVVFAQNHDQIGNRAQGERLSMLTEPAQLKAIAAITLLSPFVPLLFQGEEWGAKTPFLYFTDHEDAQLGRLVAEGRSKEFSSFRWQGEVPNPQEASTFERSKLNWTEPTRAPHRELLQWHRQLLSVRKRRGHGRVRVKFDARASWLWFACGTVLVQLNLSATPQRVPLPAGEWLLVLNSDGETPPAAAASLVSGAIELGAWGTRVYRFPGAPGS